LTKVLRVSKRGNSKNGQQTNRLCVALLIDTIVPNPFAPFTKFVRYFPEAPILLEPNTVYYLGPYIPPDSSDTTLLMYNFNYNFQGLAGWQLFPPFSWFGCDNGSGFGWQPAQTIKFRLEVTLQNQPPDCSRARPSLASIWPPVAKHDLHSDNGRYRPGWGSSVHWPHEIQSIVSFVICHVPPFFLTRYVLPDALKPSS